MIFSYRQISYYLFLNNLYKVYRIYNKGNLRSAKNENILQEIIELLMDKGMKRIDLLEKTNIGTSAPLKFGKNEYASIEALVKVCTALNVNIGDIVDLVKEDN